MGFHSFVFVVVVVVVVVVAVVVVESGTFEHGGELHLSLEACHLMKMKLENVERDNLLGLHYCLPDQILRHDRKIPETRLVEVDNTFVVFETVNSLPGLNS